MARKNALTAADAQQVEEAFRAKLVTLPNPLEQSSAEEGGVTITAETLTGTLEYCSAPQRDRQKCT